MDDDGARGTARGEFSGASVGVEARIAVVRERIAAAARAAGRDPSEVRLLAVSKTQPAAVVRSAVAAGCAYLGENRVQELVAKAEELADLAPRWAVIGPVQTNKVRDVARLAHELHTLDRPELLDALQRRLEAADRTLDVLIQVNTSGEESKSGLAAGDVGAVVRLARAAAAGERVRLRGLMTIATLGGDEAETRRCFSRLAQLREEVCGAVELGPGGSAPVELSMGMSGDLESAIAEGATVVRVGTAIFGSR